MADTQAKFLTGSLTRHIITMSLTSAVGLVALFVVDLVDMLFISMLGVAELAAAVGYAGSVLFVTTSASIGMGIAGGAMVARALGAGDKPRAAEVITHVLILGVLFAILLATLVFLNLERLTALIGATGVTQDLAVSYLSILVPTMPVLIIGITTSAALRSHGAARLSMIVTLVGGGVNAVMDPLFIFGFGLGLDGAAIASVLSRFAMAGSAVYFLVTRYGGFAAPRLAQVFGDFRPIAAIAVPAMLANVATPVGSAYVTRAASEFGEAAVAGMAVVGRVTPIAFALIFALSGAIGPIIGQNFGAGQFGRVRAAYNRSVTLIVVYVIPAVGVLYLLRPVVAGAFGAEGTARDLIYLFCGPLSLAWIFNGIIFLSNASYNNLGHPFYSTWINWARSTLGVVPFVYVGARIWGAEGVLVGQMAGGVFVAVVAYVLAERVMRKAEGQGVARAEGPRMRREFFLHHHRR